MALDMKLPISVATRSDVGRLVNEVEKVDSQYRQAAAQQGASQPIVISRLLQDIVGLNQVNLQQETDRAQLLNLLQQVRSKAPVLHMSFSVDPSSLFMERLMTWLRQHIDSQVLLQVGLLPNIGAGCVVRTTNKFFDFSLRQRFADSRPMLISKMRGAAVTDSVGHITVPAEKAAR